MKTLELENYGVTEMNTNELREIDGGNWFDDHPGWAIAIGVGLIILAIMAGAQA